MNEQAKIDEARYFLDQLSALANERQKFKYNLSGFLSAARSALQYAFEEAKTKPGGKKWYDGQISENAVVKFFKDKRDISIHGNPISPAAKISVSMSENLSLSDSLSVRLIRADGTTETDESSSQLPPSPPNPPEASVTYEYFFQDWSENDDVKTLCEKYLIEVQTIIADGAANGFLTP